MSLLKVGAVVVGGIVVFFILNSLVHVLLGLLGALLFVAVIAGGGYVAYKLIGGSRRREIRRGDRY
jgi:FtsH-binding integral membrane protein